MEDFFIVNSSKKQINNTQTHAPKPNIIIILVDDLGFSDIGCYGSEIQTPHLDKMGREGLRFTQMYNCARCCPTRASLLTGLYPHQAGVGHMVGNHGYPSYQGYLRDDCVTIPEVLKGAGYKTGMIGKWHVGGAYSAFNKNQWRPGTSGHPLPIQRGFDYYYGILEGCSNYYNPHTLMEGEKFIHIHPDIKDYYFTDDLSNHAVELINRWENPSSPNSLGGGNIDTDEEKNAPFFLYVSYTAPHWPLHAPQMNIEKYRRKYNRGYNTYRMERYERLLSEGIMQRAWPLSPKDPVTPSWKVVENQEWEDMRMAVYAAQVDKMDEGVGRIMQALKDNNIYDNTLVMFLSDNGGCSEFLHENGWIENYVYPTRDGRPVKPGNDPDRMPGGEETFMSYDKSWTNVSNTPFRLYKRWVHEGGIATPFIVSWPRVIKNKSVKSINNIQGTLKPQVVHVVDIMATCVEATVASYPQTTNCGAPISPMEGESILPLLWGKFWERTSPVFWEHEGNCAVRKGKWKLVREYDKPWELYNMEKNRTELEDLAFSEKERVRNMEKLYQVWADRCDVVPWNQIRM